MSRNHVVQLTGYTENYWIIKNQWGDDWGEDGYMRVSRDPDHNCLIGSEVFDFEKVLCQVSGCAECVSGNSSQCSLCVDQENTDLVDGECTCQQSNEVFSADGYCIACQVLGCSKC